MSRDGMKAVTRMTTTMETTRFVQLLPPLLLLLLSLVRLCLSMVATAGGADGGAESALPRVRMSYKDLLESNRSSTFYGSRGGGAAVHSMLLDEYHERLFIGSRDLVYSLSLDAVHQDAREIRWAAPAFQKELCLMQGKDAKRCANFVRALHRYNQTHLVACGTGAFHPICVFLNVGHKAEEHVFRLDAQKAESGRGKCPYDPEQSFTSTLVGGDLYAGLYSDFFGEDSAIFRTSPQRHALRTEHADRRLLDEPRFVAVHVISDTDDHDDDKVYFFFTEMAMETDGKSKARYSRIGRVCANDAGGHRVLLNKWSTFTKTRLLCSVPGPDGIDTHFDELVDVFLLPTKEESDPLIYGVFRTASHVFQGDAVCAYRMSDVRDAFNGAYAHKEGPQFQWAAFEGRVPYPRPGFCPSKLTSPPDSPLRSTRDYPEEVLHFARSHPLMARPVVPAHGRPLFVSTGGSGRGSGQRLQRVVVDRVQAEDGHYDVLFLATDAGLVLKVISIEREGVSAPEEVVLEELQAFKVPTTITAMAISVKRQRLFVGSAAGVVALQLQQCVSYGSVCAECCLARDPYCAWDGLSCSKYQHATRSSRRFRRQNILNGDPFMQCLDQNNIAEQGVGVAGALAVQDEQQQQEEQEEERVVFGVERNSTFLECVPRSLRATITWHVQHAHSGLTQEVKTDERVARTPHGLLFRALHRLDAGVYRCRSAERGFTQGLRRLRLHVIADERVRALVAPRQPHHHHRQPHHHRRQPHHHHHHRGRHDADDAEDDVVCASAGPAGRGHGHRAWHEGPAQPPGHAGAAEYCERAWCAERARRGQQAAGAAGSPASSPPVPMSLPGAGGGGATRRRGPPHDGRRGRGKAKRTPRRAAVPSPGR
uniref:Semaphorin-3E-like n=1 Tax=Petromyzon marinus TaxID=7757 RepID=A0AAJ7TWG3_PETMA|nr:semaphorin-3E-like [Petromyzon marinus]